MSGAHSAWGWTSMFGMGLIWIVLLLVLVVIALRLLSDRGHPAGEPPRREEPPLEILKRRYARGEIDREEFEQRRGDLT